jgi:hypothetical protein
MATQYVFAIGKMIAAPPPVVTVDSRLAELLTWQRETGQPLPMPVEMILWFENCGHVVDLLTGEATPLEPLQSYIDTALNEPLTRDQRADEAAAQFEFERYYRWCQAEDQDLRDGIDEADWIRSGC